MFRWEDTYKRAGQLCALTRKPAVPAGSRRALFLPSTGTAGPSGRGQLSGLGTKEATSQLGGLQRSLKLLCLWRHLRPARSHGGAHDLTLVTGACSDWGKPQARGYWTAEHGAALTEYRTAHCQAYPGGADSPTPGLTPTSQQSTSVTLTLRRQCGGRGLGSPRGGGPQGPASSCRPPSRAADGEVSRTGRQGHSWASS